MDLEVARKQALSRFAGLLAIVDLEVTREVLGLVQIERVGGRELQISGAAILQTGCQMMCGQMEQRADWCLRV